jgi:gliding motility-associated-like protein
MGTSKTDQIYYRFLMNKIKKIYLLTLFWIIPLLAVTQTTPYAELLNSDIEVCSQTTTTVELQIRFYGDSPFAYTIKLPNSNQIFEDEPIFEEDLTDGIYYATYNINFPVESGSASRTGTFEIAEVFDNNNSNWAYQAGTPISGEAISFTNWAMPEPDAGEDIDSCGLAATLNATPDPVSNTYSWETPAQGNISDIQELNAIFEGPEKKNYSLFFSQQNGVCATKDTVIVKLMGSPSASLETSSEVCGTGSQQVSLDLTFSGEDGPWDYQISDGNSAIINNTSVTASSSVTTSVTGETTFKYDWVRDANSCYALPGDISDEATILDLRPATNAGSDKIACGLNVELEAAPDKGTGEWTSNATGQLSIDSPSDANSTVTASQQGTYTLTWTENNKGCSNSDEVEIQFVEYPTLTFQSFKKDTICEGDEASFSFEVTGSNTPWALAYSDNTSQQTFTFNNPDTALTLAPATSTVYSIVSITDQYGCSTELNNQLNVNVDKMPIPDAGNDTSVCGKIVALNATMSEFAQSGTWNIANGNYIDEATNPKANFESNIWGEQIFTWAEVNGLCSASDDVTVRFDEPPVADAGDDFTLYHQYQTQLQARSPVTSQSDWLGEWQILSGSGSLADQEDKNITLSGLMHGQTTLKWTVINGVCPAKSDTLAITVKGLTYHTGISPNQDGVNDYFKLKGAYTIPNNELIVFDQNGKMVFHKRNLEEGNQWDGTDLNGSPLRSGIYYFIFKGEGIDAVKDYIVIKRH